MNVNPYLLKRLKLVGPAGFWAWGAQHWCTPRYWGRAIGKFHIITSVIITFHPITGKDSSAGCHRRAEGAWTGACSAPGEGKAVQAAEWGQHCGCCRSLDNWGLCPAPLGGAPHPDSSVKDSLVLALDGGLVWARGALRGDGRVRALRAPSQDRNCPGDLDVMVRDFWTVTVQARIRGTSGFSSSWKPPKHSLLSHYYVFVPLPFPASFWCHHFHFQMTRSQRKAHFC